MNSNLIDIWQKEKSARKEAEKWNNLPNGPKYQNDSFSLSVAHCKPPVLTRCGQQSHGGKNYWKTEEKFNKAILEYLVLSWDNIYPKILEILFDKERTALKACQTYIDKMQQLIDKANK